MYHFRLPLSTPYLSLNQNLTSRYNNDTDMVQLYDTATQSWFDWKRAYRHGGNIFPPSANWGQNGFNNAGLYGNNPIVTVDSITLNTPNAYEQCFCGNNEKYNLDGVDYIKVTANGTEYTLDVSAITGEKYIVFQQYNSGASFSCALWISDTKDLQSAWHQAFISANPSRNVISSVVFA